MQTVSLTYKFLIYPTAVQAVRLAYLLDACRLVYNLCNSHQVSQTIGHPLTVAALHPLLIQERRLSWITKNLPKQLIDNTLFRSVIAWERHTTAVRAGIYVNRPVFQAARYVHQLDLVGTCPNFDRRWPACRGRSTPHPDQSPPSVSPH